MPILYDFNRAPSRNTSMRKAGMLTMVRVSFGIAFGPFNKNCSGAFSIAGFWLVLAAPVVGDGLIDGAGLLIISVDCPSLVQLENAKMSKIIAVVRGIWFFISVAFNRNLILVAMRLTTHRSCVEPQFEARPWKYLILD